MQDLDYQRDGWRAEMTRQEHLDWCKQRAREFVINGDLRNAVASMGAGLGKHPETAALADPYLVVAGMHSATKGDADGVRRWINGFN
jgi:hypothetical protein